MLESRLIRGPSDQLAKVGGGKKKKKRGEETEKDICKLGESNEESTQYILHILPV